MKVESEFYILGYKAGFRNCILKVLKHCGDEELYDKLVKEYNSHPLLEKMKADIQDILKQQCAKEIEDERSK